MIFFSLNVLFQHTFTWDVWMNEWMMFLLTCDKKLTKSHVCFVLKLRASSHELLNTGSPEVSIKYNFDISEAYFAWLSTAFVEALNVLTITCTSTITVSWFKYNTKIFQCMWPWYCLVQYVVLQQMLHFHQLQTDSTLCIKHNIKISAAFKTNI